MLFVASTGLFLVCFDSSSLVWTDYYSRVGTYIDLVDQTAAVANIKPKILLVATKVESPDQCEETLEKILQYLYTGMYYIDEDCDILALCKAADMYQLHSLMDLITDELPALKPKPGDLADIFIAAEMINRKKMYEFAIDQLKKNKGILKDKQFEEKLKQFPEVLFKITVAISTND